jgi:hypothetical protein
MMSELPGKLRNADLAQAADHVLAVECCFAAMLQMVANAQQYSGAAAMRINETVDALCCRQAQAARHLALLLSGP